ncbi:unnamed protein product [Brachionus calyciflorus]|uniref:BED-type domain-containing protein n=1 Tax=Brachionus calyciflorus TaxID=104777 RepID=A0A814LFY4_9BILA|nr:unnamed protein product [Brachionus calyciflorus]
MASNLEPVRLKKRYQKRSWVWEYILELENGKFFCTICEKNVQFEGATNSLIWHLKSVHSRDRDSSKYNKKIKLALMSESESEDEGEDNLQYQQSTCKISKQIALNSKIVDLIVASNLPISFVDTPEFESLMKEAIPAFVIPCRQTFTNKLIPEKALIVKEKVLFDLNKTEYCSLTCDVWTSNSNMAYLGVTVHFINDNFMLTSRLLCLKFLEENHTSYYLYIKLKEIIDEWKLTKKIIKIVCDSGSNMKSAVMRFDDSYFPCFAHKLNLCVNDTLKIKVIKTKTKIINHIEVEQFFINDLNEDGLVRKVEIDLESKSRIEEINSYKLELDKTITKAKKLVGSFKHSSNLSNNLIEKQKQLNCNYTRKLVQDVSTRWNSTFDMLESILFNKEVLLSMSYEQVNQTIRDKVLNASESMLAEDYCDLMESLKDLTEILSARNYVTMSIIFPALFALINYELINIKLETIIIQNLRDQLLNSLRWRFNYLFEDDAFIASTYLNYRYKNLSFIKDKDLKDIYKIRAKNFIIKIYNDNPPIITSSNISTQRDCGLNSSPVSTNITPRRAILNAKQKRRRKENFLDALADVNDVPSQDSSGEIILIEKELEAYESHRFIVNESDLKEAFILGPLYFFKVCSQNFPCLSKVAKLLLCIPATSVPAESLFSIAGIIQDDQRNRLNPSLLDQLNFIKFNSGF